MNRIAFGQQLADQGVARFVVGRVAALFLRHDHALALWAHEDLVFGLLEVLHLDHAGVAARRHQGRLVAQVGQVGTAHAGGTARNDVGADIGPDGHLAHVDVEDLLTATDVGQRDIHLTVETARAQQGGVQNVGAVGRGNHDDAEVGLEAVHLDQHLVEGLFAFVVAATEPGTTLAAHGIDLVDEDDARRVLLGLLEHVAHARRPHADKHFHEIRA